MFKANFFNEFIGKELSSIPLGSEWVLKIFKIIVAPIQYSF